MKVLYIGYCEEGSDWGVFARNNILALNSAGIDVACRSIRIGQSLKSPTLAQFENKDIEDCDVCIQHVFPGHMLASSKFKKNIGILANDFIEINHSTWIEKLDRMDEIWVPSPQAKSILDKTVLGKKTVIIPFTFNETDYKQTVSAIDGGLQTKDKFRFYSIVENNIDTGIDQVLRCFHSEFDKTDDAILLLGIDEQTNVDQLNDKITKIKTTLGLNSNPSDYKMDVFVPKYDGHNINLHVYADCYISSLTQRTLSGEEAAAAWFGKTPIIPRGTDAEYYFGAENSVSSIYTVNKNHSKMEPDLSNGKNYNVLMCDKEIKKKMRELYEQWKKNPVVYNVQCKKNAVSKLSKFSLKSVGDLMKEALNV